MTRGGWIGVDDVARGWIQFNPNILSVDDADDFRRSHFAESQGIFPGLNYETCEIYFDMKNPLPGEAFQD